MLLCLRGRTLPLAVQLSKGTSPLCRRFLSSPVAVRLYQQPPPSRLMMAAAGRSLLQPYAFHLSAKLGIHTSSQRQKRMRETKESLLFTSMGRNWQEIKKTPKPALVIGLAGATPFVAVPLAMCFLQAYHPGLASVQVLYGACILSFLGGVRWGYTLPDNSPARLNWINLVTSAVLPYMAFLSLLLLEDIGASILGLGLGFLIGLGADVVGMNVLDLAPLAPIWYRWLRGVLTAIVLASFLATLTCASRYPTLDVEKLKASMNQPKKSP